MLQDICPRLRVSFWKSCLEILLYWALPTSSGCSVDMMGTMALRYTCNVVIAVILRNLVSYNSIRFGVIFGLLDLNIRLTGVDIWQPVFFRHSGTLNLVENDHLVHIAGKLFMLPMIMSTLLPCLCHHVEHVFTSPAGLLRDNDTNLVDGPGSSIVRVLVISASCYDYRLTILGLWVVYKKC